MSRMRHSDGGDSVTKQIERRRTSLLQGCLLAALVAIGLSLIVDALLLKAWSDCSAGSPGFNGLGAAIVGVATFVITALVFAISAWLLQSASLRVSLTVGLILAAAAAYLVFSLNLSAAPSGPLFDNNGAGSCPGNVPPWWPDWLPV